MDFYNFEDLKSETEGTESETTANSATPVFGSWGDAWNSIKTVGKALKDVYVEDIGDLVSSTAAGLSEISNVIAEVINVEPANDAEEVNSKASTVTPQDVSSTLEKAKEQSSIISSTTAPMSSSNSCDPNQNAQKEDSSIMDRVDGIAEKVDENVSVLLDKVDEIASTVENYFDNGLEILGNGIKSIVIPEKEFRYDSDGDDVANEGVLDTFEKFADQAELFIDQKIAHIGSGIANFFSSSSFNSEKPGMVLFDRKAHEILSLGKNPETFTTNPIDPSIPKPYASNSAQSRFLSMQEDWKCKDVYDFTSPEMKMIYDQLVPNTVSHEDFWLRYEFRCAEVEFKAIQLDNLMKGGSTREKADEFVWDDDDEDDETAKETPNNELETVCAPKEPVVEPSLKPDIDNPVEVAANVVNEESKVSTQDKDDSEGWSDAGEWN